MEGERRTAAVQDFSAANDEVVYALRSVERPGAARRRDHDIPTARMAATLTRPIHEMAATFSMGSQPQSANNQKRAARNALARSRPMPPMERRVSRRQMT